MNLKAIYKHLMEEHGLTAEEFANKTTLTISGVYKVLSGGTEKIHKKSEEKIIKVFPEAEKLFNIFNKVPGSNVGLNTTYIDNELVLLPNENGVVTIDTIVKFLRENEDECLENQNYDLFRRNIELTGAIKILGNKLNIPNDL